MFVKAKRVSKMMRCACSIRSQPVNVGACCRRHSEERDAKVTQPQIFKKAVCQHTFILDAYSLTIFIAIYGCF